MTDQDDYALDRSYSAASRFNLQFYLWKETLQFNLHPSIPNPEANPRIADVATGTGFWLLDLASTLPTSVQLDGFDITLTQAPPGVWLPKNINMSIWNVFEDVPKHLAGKFDIVHVRLLLLVVSNATVESVVRRLAELLKPGGYLQWDELSCYEHYVKTVDPTVPTPGFQEMHKIMDGRGQMDWTLRLPTTMNENGFEKGAIYQYFDSSGFAKANTDMLLIMLEEFGKGLAKTKGPEEDVKMQYLIQRIYKESQHGAAICVPKLVCVGRKKESGLLDEEVLTS